MLRQITTEPTGKRQTAKASSDIVAVRHNKTSEQKSDAVPDPDSPSRYKNKQNSFFLLATHLHRGFVNEIAGKWHSPKKKVTIEQRVSGAEHEAATSEISKEESEDNRHGYH